MRCVRIILFVENLPPYLLGVFPLGISAGDFRLLLHLLVEVCLPLLLQIIPIFYAQCGGLANLSA